MAKQENESTSAAVAVGNGDASKPLHVMELLKQFDFLSIGLNGKIHCSLSDRDIPLNVVAVQQHLNSKKLKKQREWYKADFTKYEPFIVPHKTKPKLLFCKVTQLELNRIPKEVEAHVNGKRYRNRKAEMDGLKQTQRQPLREASDEEEEDEEEGEGGEAGEDFWTPSEDPEAEGVDEDVEDMMESDEDEKEAEGPREVGAGAMEENRERRESEKKSGRKSDLRKGRGGKGGKKGMAGKTVEGGEEARRNGEQQNGAPPEGRAGKRRNEKKWKGLAKNKEQSGIGAAKPAVESSKSSSPSDGTQRASKTTAQDAPAMSPPSAGKAKKKANSLKDEGRETPGRESGSGELTPAVTASGGKRKHKVSEEPSSKSAKKKRKA